MKVHPTVFLAKGSLVMGDVEIGRDSGIWFNTVVRGDVCGIRIGEGTNIQDLCMLHGDRGSTLIVGNRVTVGHGAILHGCEIGDETLIGMGAAVLDGTKIGRNCIVGAKALVTAGTVVPDGSLVMGVPATVKRQVNEAELARIKANADSYISLKDEYMNL